MAEDQISAGKEQARNAAIYLIIIFSIFSVYSLLDTALNVCGMIIQRDEVFIFERIRNLIKAWYAVLNTVIYGWRTEPYRQYVYSALLCRHRKERHIDHE